MNRTVLIFRHEFITTLKRTGFIIMTLIIPVIALLAIGISVLISGASQPSPVQVTSRIGYVDEGGQISQAATVGNIRLVSYNTAENAFQAMVRGEIGEYFVIPADYIATGRVDRYTLEKQLAAPPEIAAAIKDFLTNNLLAGKVPAATINTIEAPLDLVTTRLDASGGVAADQGGYGNLIIPGIFSILLVLSLTFSSTYLLQGLGEEKENRLIEVLLSSVSTRQLLTGKVLGLGAAGLVQVLVWLVSAPLLLFLAQSTFGGFFTAIQIPANFILLGVVYFILGYSLFAVLSTGAGAVSPSAREGQQLASIFTFIAVSPLWFSSAIIAFPDSPVWVGLTIFPLTAPVVVMLRLGLTDIPVWQLAASMVVSIISILGLLAIAVRIFRTYLLMYGKRPGLGTIIRSLRSG
jgi:ABC-2 type transport system permease protein